MIENGHQDRAEWYEKSDFEIPAPEPAQPPRLRLLQGILHFFHRGKPTDLEILGRESTAMIRGTEFTLEVDAGGTTVVTLMDGVVDLSNPQGRLRLTNGQQGLALPGQQPVPQANVDLINVIQWTLYYPGILDTEEPAG